MTEPVRPSSRRGDILEGSILRNVLFMGVPSMIGFAAQTFYSLADIFWLGQLGKEEVAAVTLFSSLAWLLSSANGIVGTGSVALVSRRYGERNLEATSQAIKQTVYLKVIMAVVMGALGLISVGYILLRMHAEGAVLDHGVTYGRVYFWGLPFMFSSYTFYTALRGVGDAPRAMHIMLLSTGLNMGLDPLFIFVFGWGVAGAAWATVISAFIACLIGVLVLGSGRTNITVPWARDFHLDWRLMKDILAIGIPSGIENLARSASYLAIASLVALFGTAVVAGYGVGMRVIELGITFSAGLMLGTSAIVGQALGAGKVHRAYRSVVLATILALGIGVLLSFLEITFAARIVAAFSPDEEVRVVGVGILRYLAAMQPAFCVAITLSAAFFGAGNTWPPSVIGVITMWGVQIPFILILIRRAGVEAPAIWWGLILGSVLEAVLLVLWFRRGTWQKRRV